MGATSRSSWWEIGWSDRPLVFLMLLPLPAAFTLLSVYSLTASEWGWVEEVDWKQRSGFMVEGQRLHH